MTRDTHRQPELFAEWRTAEQRFAAWLERPGAGHIMRDLYALAAGYARDWRRTGIPVSVKLLVEIERHRIKTRRARFRRFFHGPVPREAGYTLDNRHTAYIARHIVAHRPEWDGMFEMRTAGRATRRRRVIVVEDRACGH